MELISKVQEVLGTKVWINAVVCDGQKALAEAAVERAFVRAKEIEQKYSRFIKGNDLAKLNSQLGVWVELDEEFFNLIKFGCELHEKTEGVFDLSVKSILESWGYDADYSLVQKGEGEVGKIEIGEGRRVRLSCEIELGGLGKGFAVDEMSRCLMECVGFSVNAGGDIFAKGKNVDGKSWEFFFEHPNDPTMVIGSVEVDNFALACSAPSKRRWGDKHHLVNPKTKKPADEMTMVYTQAGNCLLADSYATALFVMGYEEVRKKLEDAASRMNFPVEAMLVNVNGGIYRTKDFRGELFT